MNVAGGEPAIVVQRRPMAAAPQAQTILALLAAQKERRGSAPAILGPERDSLSYAALCGEIERLGSVLASMGLGRASRIGVSLPNTPLGFQPIFDDPAQFGAAVRSEIEKYNGIAKNARMASGGNSRTAPQ